MTYELSNAITRSTNVSIKDEPNTIDVSKLQWQTMLKLPTRRVWQCNERDIIERQRIMHQIYMIMYRKNPSQELQNRFCDLTKRIELSLYSKAASLDEYKNICTVQRRVQSLVYRSYHDACAARDSQKQEIKHEETKKRKGMDDINEFHERHKRQRVMENKVKMELEPPFPKLNDDNLKKVVTYVDGLSLLTTYRLVNRSWYLSAAQSIVHLQLNVVQFYQLSQRDFHFPQLQSLSITNSRDSSKKLKTQPVELTVYDNNDGEIILYTLAQWLKQEKQYMGQLQTLQLCSVFTNTTTRNGLSHLCNALANGYCPKLQSLILMGNSIADAGTIEVAQLLCSSGIPRLQVLDVRRNFIGELGCERLVFAMIQRSKLLGLATIQSMYLGGNIITDCCVPQLINLLQTCKELKTLELDGNFLSSKGSQDLCRTAGIQLHNK